MHNTLLSLIRRFSIAALFIAVGSAGTINAQLVNINSVDCSVGGSVAFSGGKILITATGPCISAVVSTPGISSFSPTSAQVGQPVTITGTNFASNATVTVGGFFAAIVGTPTTTSLTFTVPNSVTAGPRNVVVSVSGTPSAGVSFTVDPAPAPR